MEPIRDKDPIAALGAGAGVVIAIVVVIGIVVAAAQYTGFELARERHDKVLDLPSRFLPEVRAREAQELAGYRWVDRKAGVVAMPLERALERTLAERGER
jgi:hypothetical protein